MNKVLLGLVLASLFLAGCTGSNGNGYNDGSGSPSTQSQSGLSESEINEYDAGLAEMEGYMEEGNEDEIEFIEYDESEFE